MHHLIPINHKARWTDPVGRWYQAMRLDSLIWRVSRVPLHEVILLWSSPVPAHGTSRSFLCASSSPSPHLQRITSDRQRRQSRRSHVRTYFTLSCHAQQSISPTNAYPGDQPTSLDSSHSTTAGTVIPLCSVTRSQMRTLPHISRYISDYIILRSISLISREWNGM